MEKHYLLIETSVLPEIFIKVLQAKKMLADGSAKNVSDVTKKLEISRSAFYKYRDSIFDVESRDNVRTVNTVLKDETGALQSLLAGISSAGASIVTINQSAPESGTANVAVSVRTGGMHMSFEHMLSELGKLSVVVDMKNPT